jgi:hypothetical protein
MAGSRGRRRQPEVENLRLAVADEKHVLRLQVAMDDALLVRRRQAARDLRRDVDRRLHRQGAAGQPIAQRFAVQQFRDCEQLIVVNAGIEDREDVGVAQRSHRLRLALEARSPRRVMRKAGRQHFDGDLALEADVAGTINFTHAAGTERTDDLVRSKPGARVHRVAIVANIKPGCCTSTPGPDIPTESSLAVRPAWRARAKPHVWAIDTCFPTVTPVLRPFATSFGPAMSC